MKKDLIVKNDGSHAWCAIPPKHTPSLCEMNRVPEDEPMGSIAKRYSEAIQKYVFGKDPDEQHMLRVISAHACLPGRSFRRR